MGDKTKVSDILEELELLQKLKDAELTRLKSELERVKKIAHEVCDFYGGGDNWGHDRRNFIEYLTMDKSDMGDGSFYLADSEEVDDSGVGGKLARTKKKELEDLG